MVYDRSDEVLSRAWRAGGFLYRRLGRLDAFHGATQWSAALDWLVNVRPGKPIEEVQLWMHGLWGRALLGREPLSAASLAVDHPHLPRLLAIRARLTESAHAFWWFRTCQTFGTASGQAFAIAWTRFFDCVAAGHTHDIGFFQSGLHVLRAGEEPRWSLSEGVDPTQPQKALGSSPFAPRTITCLHGRPPRID
jgi:hypothetical protein